MAKSIFEKGCMGCLLVFGALFLFCFISFMVSGVGQDDKDNAVQYFEVVTKKGKAQLHLGIPKDSLVLILGEPDEISSHSIGSTIIEELGYKVKNDEITDLTFEFENGKLESYRQF